MELYLALSVMCSQTKPEVFLDWTEKFLNLAKSLAKDAVTTTQYNDILAKLKMVCTSSGG